jgi:CubicO group peptidase (beta-lactamase class C family)
MKKHFGYLLRTVLILTLFSVPLAQCQASTEEKTAEIDALMAKYHEYGQFNGSVLVAEKGTVIYKKGFGYANMEWEIPNTPGTKFRLGSITKQFTAMLIMQLVEEGKIKLDAPMTRYLPYYRKDTGDKVSIHQLLNHTSGIPSYTSFPGFFKDKSRDPYAPDDFVKKYCSGDLEFTPGTKYRYNNSGYFLLGAIIEKVTGKSYEDVLKEKLLDPLGMKGTGYDHHAEILKKRAAAYEKRPGGYVNAEYLDMTIPYAAGSLYSTVEDLYIWDQALYTDRLLAPKYKEMMFTGYLMNYGYGWLVRRVPIGKRTKRVLTHGGGINGFNTLIVRIVDDRHLVVLLNNTGGTRLRPMSRGISNIIYGLPYEMPKKSIADTLIETITKKDIAAGVEQYRLLKSKHSDIYDFSERELNNLGYQLLQDKKVDEAIEIFKLNVEAFPKAANAYDSLGEAYMTKGNKELAVKNYNKSLKLNPKNKNAVEKIKELEGKK